MRRCGLQRWRNRIQGCVFSWQADRPPFWFFFEASEIMLLACKLLPSARPARLTAAIFFSRALHGGPPFFHYVMSSLFRPQAQRKQVTAELARFEYRGSRCLLAQRLFTLTLCIFAQSVLPNAPTWARRAFFFRVRSYTMPFQHLAR